ncbi:MAG TPA: amidase domain-containing protein, partial [Gaiellaceae bacterium]
GNPTKVLQSGAVSSTTTYQYDTNNRLTDACYQLTCNEGTGSNDPYIHYTYDKVGNRLTEARPTGTTTYTYNADDQLTQAGSTNYTYDHNGNETAAGTRTFSYNLANRLTSTTSGSNTTNYSYDGDGNRLSATTNGTITTYLWDTNNNLPQLALERDGSGNVLRSYLYGIRRISMTSGGNPYYYLYDRLGSVVNLTSATGASEWTYSYEPFGTTRTATQNDPQAPVNLMQFDGELYDSTPGAYDLRAREFDPSTGRFQTIDPAAGHDSQAISAYAFANDNPAVFTDASGAVESAAGGGGFTINRGAIQDYLRWWARSRNPRYAYFGGNGGDCTNFVSQALYDGGWSQTSTWNYQWECNRTGCMRVGSAAWNRTADFVAFALSSGRAIYAPLSMAEIGDVIVADLLHRTPFTPDHLEIIDHVAGPTNTGKNIWVSQHSPGRYYEPLMPMPGEQQESSWERAFAANGVTPVFHLLHIF